MSQISNADASLQRRPLFDKHRTLRPIFRRVFALDTFPEATRWCSEGLCIVDCQVPPDVGRREKDKGGGREEGGQGGGRRKDREEGL